MSVKVCQWAMPPIQEGDGPMRASKAYNRVLYGEARFQSDADAQKCWNGAVRMQVIKSMIEIKDDYEPLPEVRA